MNNVTAIMFRLVHFNILEIVISFFSINHLNTFTSLKKDAFTLTVKQSNIGKDNPMLIMH